MILSDTFKATHAKVTVELTRGDGSIDTVTIFDILTGADSSDIPLTLNIRYPEESYDDFVDYSRQIPKTSIPFFHLEIAGLGLLGEDGKLYSMVKGEIE